MTIRHVVLDFDGTCTQVDETAAKYLAGHRDALVAIDARYGEWWERGLAAITEASPEAAWHVLGPGNAAPAAADPYILAGEAVVWIQEQWAREGLPPSAPLPNIYKPVYATLDTPFRPELQGVLEELLAMGLHVEYVSNSDGKAIDHHLRRYIAPSVMDRIHVTGNAGKFRILEPSRNDIRAEFRARFDALTEDTHVDGLRRPVKLRRGDYLGALADVWGSDLEGPETTIVVGDVFELDLAMPAALGSYAYLVERGPLYGTYAYERNAIALDPKHRFLRPNLEDLPRIIAAVNANA